MMYAKKLLLAAVPLSMHAKEHFLSDSLQYKIEMQASLSEGKTPLWQNANKYGLSSLKNTNGYLRAAIVHPISFDNGKKWDLGYGLDIASAFNYTSTVIVQQAFIEAKWLHGTLTIGSREYPMELKSNRLSSGSQTLGINARPIPQVRLSLPEYWKVPLTKGWLMIKGHISYGMTTDDKWQVDFTRKESKYTENTLFHSKSGYIKIGNENKFLPVSLELGLEMAAQFGGRSHVMGNDGKMTVINNKNGIGAFIDALVPGGSDAVETTYKNADGNQLGSWVAKLNFVSNTWSLGLYVDHYFEDHSSMFLLDYDGYDTGEKWDRKKKNRYLMYSLKDIMIGTELKLKGNRWLHDFVIEYIYTKYQSGPIYHDHTESFPDHIGGIDDYYNHYLFTGWQHWGQVIGNPLYMSPIYNTDGKIVIKNNRFWAFHLGVCSDLAYNLSYRFLATYQKGYGTYYTPRSMPFISPRENVSLMAETTYRFSEKSKLKGWSIILSAGLDTGNLLGDNPGIQVTITKAGLLNKKRK